VSLETVLAQIAVIQATITGIKKVYDYAPDSVNSFPAFVSFPNAGDINVTPSRRETRHMLKMLLLVSKGHLPSADKKLRPFVELTLDKFDQNVTIGATCAFSRIVHYDYGALTIGGQTYTGIVFDIEVVEHEAKTFT